MAKFCTKCGKKLEDGQVCDCSKKESSEVRTSSSSSSSFDFNQATKDYMEVVKGMFTHPIDTIRKYAKEENFVLGLIMILINSLVMGLFVWLAAKELTGVVAMIISSLGGMDGLYELGLGELNVPVSVLFKAALFGIAGFSVTALVFYVFVGPIMKGKETVKEFFSLVGVCSVLTTVTTLVACLLMYISVQVTVIFMLLAAVLYFVYLYHGLVEVASVDENRLGYVYAVTLAVSTFVLFYILPKILF